MDISITDSEAKKLEKLGVQALVLFGSQAQKVSNDASDYDIFVIGNKSAETYDFVYDLISQKVNRLVDIDIVFEENATMELMNHIVKYGLVLYQKDSSIFPNFKQKIIILHSDFAPHREVFSNATLARISI